ncbi:MAG TPA: exonuclease domain-containing protein [Solirubrobacterales bacterium]|nr:exonuclease domain-containing protein [Solirubrobacterales bacterium]
MRCESWVAIDFETASVRGTPCAVGMVEINGGQVDRSAGWLIRPPIFEFSPFNVALHGITPDMCRDAPDWAASLLRVEEFREGRPLLAHNAGFDIGVIRDACTLTEIPWPELSYVCSLVVGRRIWPGLSSYSLPFLAGHLGVYEGSHHDASADAEMAARIGCLALEATGASTLAEVAASVQALMGSMGGEEWNGCQLRDIRSAVPTEPSPGAVPRQDHPLFGKTVAFTGALAIPRREAMQAVVDRGGVAAKGVTRNTELLVTGFQDLARLAQDQSESAKLRKAQELVAKGQSIEIVGESDFVKLLADR